MATATLSKPRKATKPADTCRLSLFIRGEAYAVRFIEADPGSGVSKLIRLRKGDGTTYHISVDRHGGRCECGDFEWRHEGRDADGCKHVRAMRATGLIA